jgi:hypothetical protein
MMRVMDKDTGFQSYIIGLMNCLLGFEDYLAGKTLEIVSDAALRQKLRWRCLRRMSELSWEKTARLTLQGFEETLGRTQA